MDNLSHGRLDNLEAAQATGRLTFIEADLLDVDFNALVETHRPEVIFHLAAQIDVRNSVTDPLHDAQTNILATIRMAEAARKHGVRKIIHTSSGGAIYGVPDSFPVSEQVPVDPQSLERHVDGEAQVNQVPGIGVIMQSLLENRENTIIDHATISLVNHLRMDSI